MVLEVTLERAEEDRMSSSAPPCGRDRSFSPSWTVKSRSSEISGGRPVNLAATCDLRHTALSFIERWLTLSPAALEIHHRLSRLSRLNVGIMMCREGGTSD
jgi:hypothetical protein